MGKYRLRLYETLCLILFSMLLGSNLVSAQVDRSWLSSSEVSRDSVTGALRVISAMPAPEAAKEAEALRAVKGMASDEGKRATELLIAVALEHAGDLTGAAAAYREVMNQAKDTPHATSAAFRLSIVDNLNRSNKAIEKNYKSIAKEPEAEGWFLVSNQWIWTTTQRAALQALVDLWSDRLSFRFFSFLRAKSIFSTPYAYLFVLLVLAVGAIILELPLLVRTTKFSLQFKSLRPQIEDIQTTYRDDPVFMQNLLVELYKSHGLNMSSGCASMFGLSVVNLIFVIGVLVALSDFSPQMVLDGAKFWWIADVVKYDFRIMIVWLALNFVQTLMNPTAQPKQAAKYAFSTLIFGAIIIGIARHWHWPAYVFIFWLLLLVLGIFINRIMVQIQARLIGVS